MGIQGKSWNPVAGLIVGQMALFGIIFTVQDRYVQFGALAGVFVLMSMIGRRL